MRFSTLNFLSFESRARHSAALLWFAVFIALQLAGLFAFVRYFFRPTWDQHVSSGILAIVLTGLVCSLLLCFGEYFFHRYLLHIETVRFLRAFCTSHLAHHKLTAIGFDDGKKTVRSAYPICDVAHDDQATFPPWGLIPAFAAFTPFFAPFAFSFPGIPILIGGYAAIAMALFLYETIHVAHHLRYDAWWKPRLNDRMFGRVWRKVYGFHQAHHANYRCNLNVAGFFGIPGRGPGVRHVQAAGPAPSGWRASHERGRPKAHPSAPLADRLARPGRLQETAMDVETKLRRAPKAQILASLDHPNPAVYQVLRSVTAPVETR